MITTSEGIKLLKNEIKLKMNFNQYEYILSINLLLLKQNLSNFIRFHFHSIQHAYVLLLQFIQFT